MPDSDRLTELRRQRDLVQQHLSWLDREIASTAALKPDAAKAESTTAPAPVPTPPASAPNVGAAAASVATASAIPDEAEAEAVMAEYRVAPGDLHRQVLNGCLLYMGIAFALLAVVVVGLYFALRH